MYKIVTVTGGDCAGKETQTKLLAEALTPSQRLSAPDYDHWAGRIIQNILYRRPFKLSAHDRGGLFEQGSIFNQDKHPQILQLLHNINTWDKQEKIRNGLKTHHWVMDRYIEDAYAFGLQDGCSFDFLLELNRNFIQSDVVILMLGKGFPRPGEVQDINERDNHFQESVRLNYRAVARMFPHWNIIEIDEYRHLNWYDSIHEIHCKICDILSQSIGETVTPLGHLAVTSRLIKWQKQNQEIQEVSKI
jgi:thymidylate kinase